MEESLNREDNNLVFDGERCIGCGVFVGTWLAKNLALMSREEPMDYPKDEPGMLFKMSEE
jgi:hypothetical protein